MIREFLTDLIGALCVIAWPVAFIYIAHGLS